MEALGIFLVVFIILPIAIQYAVKGKDSFTRDTERTTDWYDGGDGV